MAPAKKRIATDRSDREVPDGFDLDGLPTVELPKRPMFFVSVNLKDDPDPSPENKGRKLGFKEESIPPRDVIINAWGEEVEIGFIITRRFDQKSGTNIPVYGQLDLERGFLIVDPKTEPAKAKYLMRCNRRKGNQNSTERYPFIYELYEPDKVKEQKFVEFSTEFEALMKIYQETDMNKIKAFALSIAVDVNQVAQAIRHDVILKLKADPSLINKYETPETKLKALVYTALDHRILNMKEYEIGFNEFKPGTNEATYFKIVPVPSGVNKIDWFVNFLQTEGSGVLGVLRNRVKDEVPDNL